MHCESGTDLLNIDGGVGVGGDLAQHGTLLADDRTDSAAGQPGTRPHDPFTKETRLSHGHLGAFLRADMITNTHTNTHTTTSRRYLLGRTTVTISSLFTCTAVRERRKMVPTQLRANEQKAHTSNQAFVVETKSHKAASARKSTTPHPHGIGCNDCATLLHG
jgi:hypothetical protein